MEEEEEEEEEEGRCCWRANQRWRGSLCQAVDAAVGVLSLKSL